MGPGRTETGLDLIDLIVKSLLETEKGALVARGNELELSAEFGPSNGPGPLTLDRVLGGVADVVGRDAQRQLRALSAEVQVHRARR